MAGANRTTTDPLTLFDVLSHEPWKYDFFHALRCIECAYPERPRLGTTAKASDEPIRFGQPPYVTFAPATIAGFEPGQDGRPPRLEVYCLGLFGPNGPLPLHLSEYARDRLRQHKDRTFARFADIFHHRMLTLFYRAWAATEPAVQFDRPDHDRFRDYIGSFFGLGFDTLRNRDRMPDHAKLYYAGRLAAPTRNAEGLEAIIGDYFQVPVELEQFTGQWMQLPADCMLRLGASPETGTLGRSAIVGTSIWECQQKFRLRFGPLTFAQYRRFLPGGLSLPVLEDLIRNYLGDEFIWDLNLVLRREEVPPLRLGEHAMLGWTTWLGGARPAEDPDDLTICPEQIRRFERNPTTAVHTSHPPEDQSETTFETSFMGAS